MGGCELRGVFAPCICIGAYYVGACGASRSSIRARWSHKDLMNIGIDPNDCIGTCGASGLAIRASQSYKDLTNINLARAHREHSN